MMKSNQIDFDEIEEWEEGEYERPVWLDYESEPRHVEAATESDTELDRSENLEKTEAADVHEQTRDELADACVADFSEA